MSKIAENIVCIAIGKDIISEVDKHIKKKKKEELKRLRLLQKEQRYM